VRLSCQAQWRYDRRSEFKPRSTRKTRTGKCDGGNRDRRCDALPSDDLKFSAEKLKWRGFFNGLIEIIEMAAGFWLFRAESLKWPKDFDGLTADHAEYARNGSEPRMARISRTNRRSRRKRRAVAPRLRRRFSRIFFKNYLENVENRPEIEGRSFKMSKSESIVYAVRPCVFSAGKSVSVPASGTETGFRAVWKEHGGSVRKGQIKRRLIFSSCFNALEGKNISEQAEPSKNAMALEDHPLLDVKSDPSVLCLFSRGS
jgi:hypothetical protein